MAEGCRLRDCVLCRSVEIVVVLRSWDILFLRVRRICEDRDSCNTIPSVVNVVIMNEFGGEEA